MLLSIILQIDVLVNNFANCHWIQHSCKFSMWIIFCKLMFEQNFCICCFRQMVRVQFSRLTNFLDNRQKYPINLIRTMCWCQCSLLGTHLPLFSGFPWMSENVPGNNSAHHTWYLSFFLNWQNFWIIKFTPKKRVNYNKIHSKLPIFLVITAKYTVNCQFFALNL